MSEEVIQSKDQIKRIPLHVEGLDDQMQGGVPEGYIVLVSGTAGSMKSSLTFNMIYKEALLNKKKTLYVTLEQSYQSLLKHMVNMDFKLDQINLSVVSSDISQLKAVSDALKGSEKGAILMMDLGAVRKSVKDTKIGESGDWLNVILNIIKKIKGQLDLDVVVIDSLNALYVLTEDIKDRASLFHVFEELRDLELTTFLISEMPLDHSKYAEYGIEDFLADGVIVVEMMKLQRKVVRQISVVKMRATAMNSDVFSLVFEKGSFKAMYGGRSPLL